MKDMNDFVSEAPTGVRQRDARLPLHHGAAGREGAILGSWQGHSQHHTVTLSSSCRSLWS